MPRAPKSNPQENAAEWLELLERAGRAIRHGQAAEAGKVSGKEFSLVDARTFWEAYLRSAQLLWSHPEAVTDYFQQLWTGWAAAWNSALTGSHGKSAPRDKRFRDERWETEPVSRGLRDSYLALEKATDTFLSALPEESKDTLRVKFYTRQFLSAAAPSNFLMLNPAAREKFIETGGGSLLAGFRNFVEDLERGDGRLDLNTDDRSAFKVGVNLATTPGKVIYQNALMQLIQYEPMTEEVRKRPFLFVPHWINKFYIQDLRPDNSVVRWLVERGHTVFLISWVNPTKEHAGMSFEDYMKLGPLAALDAIREATGEKRCDIQGFCIGGILVMATLAYLKAKRDKRIATATTIATLVDFTDVGEIGVFVDRDRVEMLRSHLKEKGYLENHHLRDMFAMMRENDLVWSFHVMNYLMGDKPPAFDILYWNGDSTRLPAAMLLWYLEKIYIENGLRKPGHLTLDGTPIDITRIDTPFFVLATKEDHIAPWASVYPTARLLKGEVKFVLGESGHVRGVINPPEPHVKYGYWTRDDFPESAGEWLKGAEHHQESWWTEWGRWLDAHETEPRVPARKPGGGKLKPIEDAPGSYVLEK
ncbi:class I poly(R)-hydroxyalkanoic acid synthase [Oricola nitratireducens]|uniref:PHA/PHB synthase family protein n=1 Tax=Oricola nitratireducens TaxID=2775868 RepID=UPI0031BAFC40